MLKELDKNTVLGIILIILMVGLYTWNASKRAEEQKKLYEQQRIEAARDPNKAAQKPVVADTLSAIASASATTIDSATQLQSKIETATQYKLENNLVSMEVSSVGAQVHNVTVKTYTSHTNKPVKLLPTEQTEWNLSIPTRSGMVSTLQQTYSSVVNTPQMLVLRAADGTQVTYRLDSNAYTLHQSWSHPLYDGQKQAQLTFKTQMISQEVNLERERQYSTIKYLLTDESYTTNLNPAKNSEEVIEEPFDYISYTQQFFNATVIPAKPFVKGKVSTYYLESEHDYVKKYQSEMTLSPSDSLSIKYYIGPSSYKLLKAEGQNLEEIVPLSQDFFLFRWVKIFNEYLIIPIFNFLSRYFSNYGIIILLLTLIVKTALLPLSYKTYKSGVAMKVLKPELEKLKAKHGDDQMAYSQEQMKLYGEYGVSPFGGCMPMLLQMPILIAMFSFFPAAIELRHKQFLWATDLSTYDSVLNLPFNLPLYGDHVSLFALLMTVTQIATTWYMQRLQPSNPQADQMKMISYIMPIMFLLMFNSFPAAITYYYLLQNVISIAQQYIVTKLFIKEEKVRAEIEENKKKPKKQSLFQQKMQEAMALAEEQRKMQQKNDKK